MNKNTLILVIVLLAAFLIIVWALLTPRAATPPVLEPVTEATDAVEELTEGTAITDIEQDLEALLQEEAFLGDLEAELRQMDQQIEAEGL